MLVVQGDRDRNPEDGARGAGDHGIRGRGEIGYLSKDTVALVRSWLHRTGVTGGRSFRSVRKRGGICGRLDPSQVPRIFKEMARRAGLPAELVEGLSGHRTASARPKT